MSIWAGCSLEDYSVWVLPALQPSSLLVSPSALSSRPYTHDMARDDSVHDSECSYWTHGFPLPVHNSH